MGDTWLNSGTEPSKMKTQGRIEIDGGSNCKLCGAKMMRYHHAGHFKPKTKSYFSYWDICKPCRRIQNYESARVFPQKSKHQRSNKRIPRSKFTKFYRSWEWKKLRYEVLKEFGAQCQCCGATAQHGVRIVVDHIKPIRNFWQLRLVKANCQVLCNDCNMGKASSDETAWTSTNIVPFPNVGGL
jgi:5-methylcytosine-specific restriction protein A